MFWQFILYGRVSDGIGIFSKGDDLGVGMMLSSSFLFFIISVFEFSLAFES